MRKYRLQVLAACGLVAVELCSDGLEIGASILFVAVGGGGGRLGRAIPSVGLGER